MVAPAATPKLPTTADLTDRDRKLAVAAFVLLALASDPGVLDSPDPEAVEAGAVYPGREEAIEAAVTRVMDAKAGNWTGLGPTAAELARVDAFMARGV